MRVCESCGSPITQGRSDRRFCTSRCRVAGHRSRERGARKSRAAILDEIDERLTLALAEPRLVALIARAAETNWRASAWLLERR